MRSRTRGVQIRPIADDSTQRRDFLLFFGFGGVSAALQNAEAARLAAAVVRTRAEFATVLAPLNHMLRNGFFLVQGFFMSASIEGMSSGRGSSLYYRIARPAGRCGNNTTHSAMNETRITDA